MKVEDGDCKEGWEAVFSREWDGIDYKCLKRNKKKGKRRECLESIAKQPSITMTDLGGVTICGKRGGRPFTKALRPTTNGACP